MSKPSIKKLYYSIGEVAELTALKPYVLRYWETEFPILKPTKNRAGNRIYKDRDIKIIFHIKYLLYDQKYTIEGARNQLKSLNFEELGDTDTVNAAKEVLADESKETVEKIAASNGEAEKLRDAFSKVREGLIEIKYILGE